MSPRRPVTKHVDYSVLEGMDLKPIWKVCDALRDGYSWLLYNDMLRIVNPDLDDAADPRQDPYLVIDVASLIKVLIMREQAAVESQNTQEMLMDDLTRWEDRAADAIVDRDRYKRKLGEIAADIRCTLES
jgi:hypothetical protein